VSFQIEPLEFPPDWQGLYDREQQFPDESPHLYAATAENVEYYGSVMRKRAGSKLLNGVCDVTSGQMHTGSTTLPDLENENWRDWNDSMVAGTIVNIQILTPGDPHYGAVLTFTITANDGFGDLTVTPAAPYEIPYHALLIAIPWTQGRRIGGMFQPHFRNGSFPLLVNAVSNTTGELTLHIQGNRQCRPLNLYTRIPATTISAVGGANIFTLASIEGLVVGDWINFPTATMGTQNGKVAAINIATKQITLDPSTTVTPTPAAGAACRFLPNTCPGYISPSRPIGLGKLSAAHMGNRSCLAQPQFPPLRYAHTDSNTVDRMLNPNGPYNGFYCTVVWSSGVAPLLPGRQVLLTDISESSAGQAHLRTISSCGGYLMQVTPDLPWALSAGCLVDVLTISRVGLRKPATSPTLSQYTVGAMVPGTYSVRLTYVSTEAGSFVESEACTETPRFTLPATGGGGITVSNIPMPLDPRIDQKWLYRTSCGGDGVWYLVARLDKSVTSFNMIGADTTLGTQLDEFINYPPYETMEVVVEWPHAQRLMGIAQVGLEAWAVVWSDGPDVLRAQVKPESWPVDNFLFVGLDSGDKPKGIAAFYDSMLIFCERSIWRIQGNPPDLVVEPVNFQQHDQSGIGLESHQTLVVDQNEVIFPGADGVYMIDRFQGVATGFQSQRISRQIDRLWDSTYNLFRNRAHAVFYRARRQYRLFWPLDYAPQSEPDAVLTYQFDADVNGSPHFWAKWTLAAQVIGDHNHMSCSTVAQPELGDAYLFASMKEVNFVGTRDGGVLGMDYVYDFITNGFSDFTIIPYHFEYRTLWFNPGGQLGLAALGRFLHLALLIGGLSPHEPSTLGPMKQTLTTEVRTSEFEWPVFRDPVPPNVPLEIVPKSATWGAGFLYLYRLVLLCRGQYHQIAFIDDDDRAVELHRMTYFFQRLPETVIPEDLVQVEPTD